MTWAFQLLDRIDAFGQRIPLTAALPLAGLYLASLMLWAAGFQAEQPALFLVFAPAWAPAMFCRSKLHIARAERWSQVLAMS
jgi:hypothetical protein